MGVRDIGFWVTFDIENSTKLQIYLVLILKGEISRVTSSHFEPDDKGRPHWFQSTNTLQPKRKNNNNEHKIQQTFHSFCNGIPEECEQYVNN